MSKQPYCKYCLHSGHYQTFCLRKPVKRINRRGKVAVQWQNTRNEYLQANPPKDGYYVCYICNKKVLPSEITLDHVLPRSSNPELRFEFNNLKPCCYLCNMQKGSKKL